MAIEEQDRVVRVLVLAFVCVACGGGRVSPTQSCSVSSDCTMAGLPFCVDGECRACDGAATCTQAAPVCTTDTFTCGPCSSDADCAGYPAASHCGGAGGACVGCIDSTQCANPTPTCDITSHGCRTCATDDDCTSGVCDRDSGACAVASFVLYAGPAGGDTAACTQADPCTIAKAVSLVDATRNVIKLLPGDYHAEVTITNKTLTVHGFGATWHPAPAAQMAVHIGASAHVAIHGVAFITDGVGGIDCSTSTGAGPYLELDRASLDSVSDAASNLLYAAHCTGVITRSSFVWHAASFQMVSALAQSDLTFRRTRFQGGDGIGAFSSTKIHVINSVWQNVTGQEGALRGDPTASGDVSLSTLVDSPIHCGGDNLSAPTWNWSSNVVYGSGTADVADGPACTFHYNIMVPQGTAPLGANNVRDRNPMFVDLTHADYHLMMASPAKDTADPAMTATEDYDGLPRPEGPHDDCGAFEYRP